MDRLRGIIRVFLAAALCAGPVLAQGVRITRTDGSVLEGEFQGYEAGHYRVLVGDRVELVPEADAVDVVLVGAPLVERPLAAPGGPPAGEDARAAFERGAFEEALQKIANALDALQSRREELNALALRAYQAVLPKLLEEKDALRLAEALRRMPALVPADARAGLVKDLGARLAEQLKSEPDDPFTTALAEGLAGLVEEGSFDDAMRAALAEIFVQRGDRESDQRNYPAAAALYRGALKLDPARKGALKERLLVSLLATAKRRLEAGDGPGAAAAAREALALEPGHPDAGRIIEDAEFAEIRHAAENAVGSQAEAALRAYLARARRPEHREWATQTLAQLAARSGIQDEAAAEQLRAYFPVKAGRTLLYRRASGDLLEKVRVESVARQGDALRVSYVVQETYRDWSTSKNYALDVRKDSVSMASGSEREMLLKFPLRLGDTWAWRSGDQEFRRTVSAADAVVEVGPPDKRRRIEDCIIVEFTSTSERGGRPVTLTSRSTYAPGVGLVRLEYLDPEFRKYSLDLVSVVQE
jgi:hypothetical protein